MAPMPPVPDAAAPMAGDDDEDDDEDDVDVEDEGIDAASEFLRECAAELATDDWLDDGKEARPLPPPPL
jgi:hypothetical protein